MMTLTARLNTEKLSAGTPIARHASGCNGTLTNEGTITATQFKPVADLYGLTSPTGGETSFTFDAVEARDFIDGGWSCQEYVELERFQEAVSGNSPVIPDGWVACSERMPEDLDQVYLFTNGEVLKDAFYNADKQLFYWEYSADTCKASEASHWKPMIMPAAPRQEA
ncbi:hypothetical protein CKK21_22560 [Enterobacter cloacae]|nr:hypothetical protein CKK21_22560 [Enterobacter cloacae]